jgi:hypothetical protein
MDCDGKLTLPQAVFRSGRKLFVTLAPEFAPGPGLATRR